MSVMTSQIRILSDQTINQIAAGEVIENPASVVKELVENAIDAGSTHLKIEILGGGFQLIKIVDNGSGMSESDAALCLKRHATSKLTHLEDLFALKTMGFRGEALASIAAISKMRLFTALENGEGCDMEIEGGKVVQVIPGARSRGTTIEVRSLFYNVPARKKFQKTPAASSAEITKIITLLSLGHPEIGFELILQNRPYFSLPLTPGHDFLTLLKNRCDTLLSPEFVPSCRDFQWQEKELKVQGLLAAPSFSRHNRTGQYLFVNRRPVFCLQLAYAIADAYGTRINPGRHPVYLLHLEIPPDQVDVNVHPQKKEIRLRDEAVLKSSLHSAVNAALGSGISHFTECAVENKETTPGVPSLFKLETAVSRFNEPSYADFSQNLIFKEDQQPPVQELPLDNPIRIIGLHGKYLLVDAKSLPSSFFTQAELTSLGIVWIDLPTAETRIQFDLLMMRANENPLSQALLFPVSLDFSKAEAQLLGANLDLLQQLGIQVRQLGGASFIIDGIPPFIDESQIHSIFLEILAKLEGIETKETHLRSLAAALSRKTHQRYQFYSREEALLIVKKLMVTSDPIHCPLGKKTLWHMREDEIENSFRAKFKSIKDF